MMRITLKKISLITFACLTLTSLLSGQQTDRPAADDKPREKTSGENVPADDQLRSISDKVYECAFSDSELVRKQAFLVIRNRPVIFKQYKEGNQRELIRHALKDSDAEVRIVGATLIRNAEFLGLEREEILFDAAFEAKDDDVRAVALGILDDELSIHLPRFCEMMLEDPLGDHAIRIGLIERWGVKAADATKPLMRVYEARKADYEKKSGKLLESARRPFEYLDILLALSEIGAPAIDAMPVAIRAIDERDSLVDRTKYQLAGLILLEKLSASEKVMVSRISEPAYRTADSLLKRYDKNSDGELSSAEIASANSRGTFDANRDGTVTRIELAMYYETKYSEVRSASSVRRRSRSSGGARYGGGVRQYVDQLIKSGQ